MANPYDPDGLARLRRAALQRLWEESEALADAHETELRAAGLPLPGEPGAHTPGELPRGYLAEKRATFEAVGATFPATIAIPIELPLPTGWAD